MDLGETVPFVCRETGLTVTAGGSEGSNIAVEEVLLIEKEEDHLAVALPAAEGVDKMASGLLSKRRREEVSSEPSGILDKPRSINDLPDEIILKIMSYFGTENLCLIIADVCERWNALSKEVIIWKKMSYSCDRTSDINRIVQVLTVAPALQSLIIREREDVLRIVETLSVSRVGLTELILKNCQLYVDGFRILNNISTLYPDLEVLILEGCSLRTAADYRPITHLTKLSELKLSHTQPECLWETVDLIVDSCQNLTKLNLVEVNWCQDYHIIHIIDKLGKQLTHLVLNGGHITDDGYSYLENCTSLQELQVNDCEHMTDEGFLEGIGPLQGLTSFRIEDCYQLTAEAFSTFLHQPSMATIVSLHLGCDNLDDDGMEGIAERCINLKELTIGHSDTDPYTDIDVSDKGVSMVISHCIQLRILCLIRLAGVSGEKISEVVPAYPHLRVLAFKECPFVTDETLVRISAAAPELVVLDFHGNIVGGVKKEELSDRNGNLTEDGYDLLRQWALDR